MKNLLHTLFALVLLPVLALAQSSPHLYQGQVPTASQWNSYFTAKQDTLGYTPVSKTGDTMTGPLITFGPLTSGAGFRLPHGVTPTTPTNGDLWTTTSGLFVRVNGTTVGPLMTPGGGFILDPGYGGLGADFSAATGVVQFTAGVAAATLTPSFTSIINTGTLTLPTSTDTLVGRATTDTLTGKSVSGATNTLTSIPLSAFTNLGTTTTVLHGNAAGNPTFGVVALGDITTVATNTVLGNATAGTAVVTALPVGSCSTAASALLWTTNSGFSCNTSITAATAGVATLGTTVAVSNSASYFPMFAASSSNGNQPFNLGTGLTFNPNTNNLSTTTFTGALSGNATTATSATSVPAATITLAMMADLAQDQFIGRTTASTGVPQTATITSVARSALDDTTLVGMLDTLQSTKPLVIAYNSATDSNVTGDGTVYTIIYNTEIVDRASNYNNATGIFTAPFNGYYRISAQAELDGMSAQTAWNFKLVATGQDYMLSFYAQAFTGTVNVGGSRLIFMTAGDTCSTTIAVSGGSAVVDITGAYRDTVIQIEYITL